MSKNHWIIGIIAVIFIFAGFFVGSKKSAHDVLSTIERVTTEKTSTPKTATKTNSVKPVSTDVSPKVSEKPSPYVQVSFTNNGFSPNQIEVRAGQVVRFVNNSSLGLWVASNPYPTNDIYSELNQGKTVGKGGVYDFAFTRVGAWGYHNHVAPSKGGIVIVHVQ